LLKQDGGGQGDGFRRKYSSRLTYHSSDHHFNHYLSFHPELPRDKIKLQPWTNLVCGSDAPADNIRLVPKHFCSRSVRGVSTHFPLDFPTPHREMKET